MENINWLLAGSFLAAGIIDLAAVAILAVGAVRRLNTRWRYFWLGVLVFFLSQGVTRIPAMIALQTLPAVQSRMQQPWFFWSFLAFAAVTAGLFEETGRAIAFRYAIAPKERTWRNAVTFGVGHGGLEAVGIGCLVLLGLIQYIVITVAPPEIFGAYQAQIAAAKSQLANLQGWEPLLGAWERLCALALHIALSVMVMRAFTHGVLWWWLALAAHAIVDFVAPATLHLASNAWGTSAALLVTEAVVTLFAVASVWFTRQTNVSPSLA